MSTNTFTAYRVNYYGVYPELVPADPARKWMDEGTKGWANRCLPLRIANQAGWFVMNPIDFEVIWDGRNGLDAVRFQFDGGQASPLISSMFGYGIFTFTIPYLFRTPEGMNLLARGPANYFVDGAAPLDGIVETDWLPYTFTMNWKLTRRLKWVRFSKGEPICMLVPLRCGEIESLPPEIRNLDTEPALHASWKAWHESRLARVEAHQQHQTRIEGNYIRGEGHLGEKPREHRTKVGTQAFTLKEAPGNGTPFYAPEPDARPQARGLWSRITGK